MQAAGSVPVFYEDVYRTELEVWVDGCGVDERFGPYLVLSETLCHPQGGGQKGDRGWLALPAEDAAALGMAEALPVTDTRKGADGAILHCVEGLEPERAEAVLVGSRPYTLRLDWAHRHTQMRLHSTAHLLHCMMEQVLGTTIADPELSDLQLDHGVNRYGIKDLLTEDQAAEAVVRLNAFTAEGHGIRTYPDPERAGFRYWQCEDWVIPCGGTHPADTREIGTVAATMGSRKGRTHLRFWLAGDAPAAD